jgi:hypothetical protein
MMVLYCADVRASGCTEVFHGETDLAVLAQILEHWAAVHDPKLATVLPLVARTSALVSRMRAVIRAA